MESPGRDNLGFDKNGVMPSSSVAVDSDILKNEECLSKKQKLVLLVVAVVIVIGGLVVAIVIGVNSPVESRASGDGETEARRVQPNVPWVSATGSYRFASVAADAEICSQIGTEIMARYGGSAVDAAIAAMLCIGVANPHSTGIGGGFFMTIYEKPRNSDQRQKSTIMARETAPGFATQDMYVNDTTKSSTLGGKAIAVPGEVRGYYEAWKQFGRASWQDLFQPTIRLARDGFPVSKTLHDMIHGTYNSYFESQEYPLLRETFTKEDGSLVVEGDLLKRPKLADTLEQIANDSSAFYEGTLAEDIIQDITEQGGNITLQDLKDYTARVEEPLSFHLENGNFTMLSPRPPSGGVVLGHILKILDGYNFDSNSDSTTEKSILLYHRIVEAFKFAFARRSELGDPMANSTSEIFDLVDKMLSDNFTEDTRKNITDEMTQPMSHYNPSYDTPTDSGTSHLSVLSPDGSAVSITSTINLGFGSKVVGKRTGIIFNNEMDDFSTPGTTNAFGLPASPANYIKPGKRPLSSMSPVIVLDGNGDVRFVSGASGGPRITTSTAMATIFALWLEKNIQEIADTPRLHHQLSPEKISYQSGFNLDILDGLQEKGHVTEERSGILAVVQNILNKCDPENKCSPSSLVECLKDKCIMSSSDGAKGGAPDGY